MAYTTIDKPTDYFNTKLYTGTGASHAITGVGFQPDLIWIKNRDTTGNHALFNVISGVQTYLNSNTNYSEQTSAPTVTSFDSDGFTVGSSTDLNGSGNDLVSWNWLASNTTASNTDGSITSSVSANTTAGFSIVTYTGNGVSGATVGHGLSTTAPKIVLIKKRNAADPWTMLNTNIDLQKYMRLDDTTGAVSDPMFNNTAPTTSVFTVDSDGQVNGNTNTFVAYCFSEVKGYSKFGSYTGNGNADGTFVYTGFKPAWVMIKNTSTADPWLMLDNKRDTFNAMEKRLDASDSDAEATGTDYADFLSNGFKIIGNLGIHNNSGQNYIYMAFAENPFVTSTGIPTTAR